MTEPGSREGGGLREKGGAEEGRSPARPLLFGEALAAALWGFGEAVFFFIVPDVLITMIAARRRLRAALLAALIAAAAALAGGWLMYAWGAGTSQKIVFGFLDVIPAVSREMIHRALTDMQAHGAWAMLWGAFSGTPYKIYAALAPHAGVSLAAFLLVSIPARLLRFVLVALLAHGAATILQRLVPRIHPLWLWAGFWLIFYGLWFTLMPT